MSTTWACDMALYDTRSDACWFVLERLMSLSRELTAALKTFPEASCVFWPCAFDKGKLISVLDVGPPAVFRTGFALGQRVRSPESAFCCTWRRPVSQSSALGRLAGLHRNAYSEDLTAWPLEILILLCRF